MRNNSMQTIVRVLVADNTDHRDSNNVIVDGTIPPTISSQAIPHKMIMAGAARTTTARRTSATIIPAITVIIVIAEIHATLPGDLTDQPVMLTVLVLPTDKRDAIWADNASAIDAIRLMDRIEEAVMLVSNSRSAAINDTILGATTVQHETRMEQAHSAKRQIHAGKAVLVNSVIT
ncbi:MAG: hypothetical protein NVS4B11_31910 [Ktedonobacteraceae bacterium]